jgi:hypothetical protein
VGFNNLPIIEDFDVQPGTSITTCDTARFTVVATDPDGDPLRYFWRVSKAPELPDPTFTFDGASATLKASSAGDYWVSVAPADDKNSSDSLSVRIQVAEASCP